MEGDMSEQPSLDPSRDNPVVRMRISAAIQTDAWSDYEQRWGVSERVMFDVAGSSHFGWCVGEHVVEIAKRLIAKRSSDDTEAYLGLADYLEQAAKEISRIESELMKDEDERMRQDG
jgi:hypothetical protein